MRKNLDPFNNFEDADLWRVLEEVEELDLIFFPFVVESLILAVILRRCCMKGIYM